METYTDKQRKEILRSAFDMLKDKPNVEKQPALVAHIVDIMERILGEKLDAKSTMVANKILSRIHGLMNQGKHKENAEMEAIHEYTHETLLLVQHLMVKHEYE